MYKGFQHMEVLQEKMGFPDIQKADFKNKKYDHECVTVIAI